MAEIVRVTGGAEEVSVLCRVSKCYDCCVATIALAEDSLRLFICE